MFRAIVHDHIDNYATSTAGTIALAKNLISLDDAPLSARPPILFEFIKRISFVIVGMLLPLRVMKINSVGRLKILLLKRGKEFIRHMLFRPETVKPHNP